MATKKKTTTIGIRELKDGTSAWVEQVEKSHEPISITRHGKIVARLVPTGVWEARDREGLSNEVDSILESSGLLARRARHRDPILPQLKPLGKTREETQRWTEQALQALHEDRDDG